MADAPNEAHRTLDALCDALLMEFGLGRTGSWSIPEARAEMLPHAREVVASLAEEGFGIIAVEAFEDREPM